LKRAWSDHANDLIYQGETLADPLPLVGRGAGWGAHAT